MSGAIVDRLNRLGVALQQRSPEATSLEVARPTDVRARSFAVPSPPKLDITSTRPSAVAPKVCSFAIGRVAIKTQSFRFSPPVECRPSWLPEETAITQPKPSTNANLPARLTHLRPPADVIKLEDRLLFALQPPLETWLARGALEFPFEPFRYQYEGVAFLYPRYSAVLADEMGLGKTMQAITALRLLLHAGEVRTVLLVCPKPLVSNWRREFAQWAPEVPVMVVEGDQARRRWQWQLPDTPLRIANYELLMRDRDLIEQGELNFDLVLLDESQRIKNRSSTTSHVVRAIRRQRSWALTGTPVENSAEDLVGIFEFVSPGHLNAEMKPRRIGKLAADYILRRTKDQVLADLPPKLFRDADIELTAAQRESYRLAEEDGILRLSELGEGASIQHVFELVLRLKQICNFDPATRESAKLERLEADLEEVASSGQKAIVFSQWVETLTHLSRKLKRFHPLEYHGRIPQTQREQVIERFRQDKRSHVILMSYGAGGVGLNLQFCRYVFLFDRWWNPAVEDQAINRAHRIGAAGSVTISRFVAINTIEERIQQVLEHKRELFDTILSGAEGNRHSGMTHEELFGLFRLRAPHGGSARAA